MNCVQELPIPYPCKVTNSISNSTSNHKNKKQVACAILILYVQCGVTL